LGRVSLPRALFAALFDDAAVFPPGNSPLDTAVAEHRRLLRGPDRDLIGPLLLPPSAIPAAIDLAGLADLTGIQDANDNPPQDSGPLQIVIAARPGTPREEVEYAAQLASADSRVEPRAVEIGWDEGWERIDLPAPTVVVEIPRGTEQALALTEIATAAAERPDTRYAAKFRTGATDAWAWPTEHELATSIQGAIAMEVPLKLTGGLHHAVRGSYPEAPGRNPQDMHGVLNVLAAFAAARAGRPVSAIQATLEQRDPGPLIAGLSALNPVSAARLRGDFPSYGCCTVTDPITELITLDVLEGPRS